MDFFKKKKKEEPKVINLKEKYYFFTLLIENSNLTFISKEKNQIDSRVQNIKDSILKGKSYELKVTEISPGTYSFDIKETDDICEIIIPNLKDIKIIKTGETEI